MIKFFESIMKMKAYILILLALVISACTTHNPEDFISDGVVMTTATQREGEYDYLIVKSNKDGRVYVIRDDGKIRRGDSVWIYRFSPFGSAYLVTRIK